VNGSREADRVTGVVVTALAADGAQLREVHVTLHEGTSLSVHVPEGTRTLTLEGTNSGTQRTRIELGPERRVLPAPSTLRRWRRRY
jgi:hypothetical protein